MFIAVLFAIVKTQKLPKCPSTGRTDNLCIHTIEFYKSMKTDYCYKQYYGLISQS